MSDSKPKLAAVTETTYCAVDEKAAQDAAARRSSKKPAPLAKMAGDSSIVAAISEIISTEPSPKLSEPLLEGGDRATIPVAMTDLPAGIHEAIARDQILGVLSVTTQPSTPPAVGKPAILPPPLNPTDRLPTDIDGLAPDATLPPQSGDSPDEAPDLMVGEAALDPDEEFEVSFDDLLSGATIPDSLVEAADATFVSDNRPTLAPPSGIDFEEASSRKTGDYTEIAEYLFKFMEKDALTGRYSPEYEDYLTAQRAHEDSRQAGTPIAEPNIVDYVKKYADRINKTKNKS